MQYDAVELKFILPMVYRANVSPLLYILRHKASDIVTVLINARELIYLLCA
jgi:hypothetical protein